ncbi:MAG: NUDIX hydrolase [Saccharofermentans sp.]|jgi:ADP-ribose pyrophosphatase YjhB (NUDIX family)|nr:NUDIX hydrolase [Saccharofermentans sp.]
MIVRNCSGGIVFKGDKVLLVCNDKQEWGFPKGAVKINSDLSLSDFARERIKFETGVDAKVIAPCGKTNYEFYSITRRKPVHNNISWFVMVSGSEECKAFPDSGTVDCRFIEISKALEEITYSQDKSLLMMAYQKYRESIKD